MRRDLLIQINQIGNAWYASVSVHPFDDATKMPFHYNAQVPLPPFAEDNESSNCEHVAEIVSLLHQRMQEVLETEMFAEDHPSLFVRIDAKRDTPAETRLAGA
jgi:hypothetical protein